MIIAIAILIYILAAFVQSRAVLHISGNDFVRFIICLASVPMIPAFFCARTEQRYTLMCIIALLLYIICLILFFI